MILFLKSVSGQYARKGDKMEGDKAKHATTYNQLQKYQAALTTNSNHAID
jgi:hypothetical protein